MRSKTVLRYYCDFCSKGGFRKPDMANHEAACTMNPKRTCYLCGGSVDLAGIIVGLRNHNDVALYPANESENHTDKDTWDTKSKAAIEWLMWQVDQCPACALSVLRQGRIFAFEAFDYKEAVMEWHAEKSRELNEACGGVNV